MAADNVTTPAVREGVSDLYKMMHDERLALGEETRKLETLTMAGVAALYAWLATHNVHGRPWLIGVALVVLACFRALVLGGRILFIKRYLVGLEREWFGDKAAAVGYENHFARLSLWKWYMHVRFTAVVVWLVLLLATAVAPCYLDTNQPATQMPAAKK